MGFSPPEDAPSPDTQAAAAAAASFAPTPPATAVSICGFQIPGLPKFPPSFSFSFPPDFGFPPKWAFPPLPSICDLAQSIADEVGSGGGRAGTLGLEADPED